MCSSNDSINFCFCDQKCADCYQETRQTAPIIIQLNKIHANKYFSRSSKCLQAPYNEFKSISIRTLDNLF